MANTKIANISINIDVKIMLMMMVWSTSVSKSASKHPSAASILEYSRVFDTLTNTRYPKPSRDHISSLDLLGWLKASQQIAKSEQQQQFEKERNIDPFKQLAKKLSCRKICHKYLQDFSYVITWKTKVLPQCAKLRVNMALWIYVYVRYINFVTHRGIKMGSLTISYNNPCFYHCICAIAFVYV